MYKVGLMEVTQYITEGWPIAKNIEGAAKIYNCYRDELRFEEGVTWRFERIVVPKRLRLKYVNEIHYAHPGVEHALRRAREYMFWPHMNQQIKENVLNSPNPIITI
jgi:hypothetical protein